MLRDINKNFSVLKYSLKLKEGIYGLEHVAIWILRKIKGKAYEREIPLVIGLFQIIIIVLGFLIFF